MQVILTSDVPKIGAPGTVARVSDGYARNYLIPRGLALPMTDANKKQLERHSAQREVQLQKKLKGSRSLKAKIESLSITIPMLIQDEEKVFGSVTTQDIVKALKDEGIDIEKSDVQLDEPIKTLGVYEVPVKLHPDVTATVKIWIVKK